MFKFFENSTILFYSTAKIRFSGYRLSSVKWLVLYSAIFIIYWKISLKNITTLISFHLFFFSFLSRFIYNCINFCNSRMIIRIVPFAFYIQKKFFFSAPFRIPLRVSFWEKSHAHDAWLLRCRFILEKKIRGYTVPWL